MVVRTAKTIRRENFQRLVREVWGDHRALAANDLGFEQPQLVTRLIGSGKSRKDIGDALARKIETAARKTGAAWVTPGWLDLPHDEVAPSPRAREAGVRRCRSRIASVGYQRRCGTTC